jgi:hypothetical protein
MWSPNVISMSGLQTLSGVLLTYFNDYLPRAMNLAETLRRIDGDERYVWTIAAWMLYEYLEQASREDRKRMEAAVTAGDIAWHAMPFTWQSEMLDRSLIASALKLSASLDIRFGKRTIAGKLTDVPGHTRGLISPLAEAGIQFLDIGDNPGCKAPAVPSLRLPGWQPTAANSELAEPLNPEKMRIVSDVMKYGLTETEARRLISDSPFEQDPHLFNWRNPEGAQLTVLYHPFGYGSTTAIPGTNFAISIRVAADNSGPHSANEVKAYYASLRGHFPGARIVATDLSTIARALQTIRPHLPLVTDEIGDTWIYGVGSDPGKVSRFRELARLRREWLSQSRFASGDALDLALTSRLILGAEHNWGLSTGQYLKHHEVYSPDQLAAARIERPEFQKADDEWVAKRRDTAIAITTLPPPLQREARERLTALTPSLPDSRDLKRVEPGTEIETALFVISFDRETSAIVKLRNRKTGRAWASSKHPLASFRYETFTSVDFTRFNAEYNTARFASNDFGKPGLDRYPVQSRAWQPRLSQLGVDQNGRGHRIVADLLMPEPDAAMAALVAWPKRMSLEVSLPEDEPTVHIVFQCFDKRANRLPEAMWLSFSPDAPDANGWLLEKVEQPISPLEVMANGNRHLHAVTKDVSYRDANGTFVLETLDAPLVAPGQRSLLKFDNTQPQMSHGVHVNLYNNLWGTAFPQWYGDDMRFRFVIKA